MGRLGAYLALYPAQDKSLEFAHHLLLVLLVPPKPLCSTYMVPTPISHGANRYPRLTYSLFTLATHGLGKLTGISREAATQRVRSFAKREDEHDPEFAVFAVLIPVLVLLSGLFAGLTLGYMSLDETQLQVLSISGTP